MGYYSKGVTVTVAMYEKDTHAITYNIPTESKLVCAAEKRISKVEAKNKIGKEGI